MNIIPQPSLFEERACTRCQKVLSITDFCKGRTKGHHTWCQPCQNDSRRERARARGKDAQIPELRCCPKCKTVKPSSDFYKCSYTSYGLSVHCKACQANYQRGNVKVKQYHQEYHQKEKKAREKSGSSKEYFRTRWLKHKYGLTIEQFEEMLKAQDSKCAICGEVQESEKFHIDHNHDTGAVRALLCKGCNQGLGLFREDSRRLLEAVNYLERHNNGKQEIGGCSDAGVNRERV